MRKQFILLFALIVNSLSSLSDIKNPYANLKFDKVIMYDFSGGKGWNESIVDKKGGLATSITKLTKLDIKESGNLNDLNLLDEANQILK